MDQNPALEKNAKILLQLLSDNASEFSVSSKLETLISQLEKSNNETQTPKKDINPFDSLLIIDPKRISGDIKHASIVNLDSHMRVILKDVENYNFKEYPQLTYPLDLFYHLAKFRILIYSKLSVVFHLTVRFSSYRKWDTSRQHFSLLEFL